MVTDKWKILQLTPAAGWVARFQGGAAPTSETALASWALVDDGTRTFMVGMIAVASDPACAFAPRDEHFIGYLYRGTEVPLAAELPAIQKVAKTGSAWKSTTRPDAG